jgi:hypothetical protein
VHDAIIRDGDVLHITLLVRREAIARPTPMKRAAAKEFPAGVRIVVRPRNGVTVERLQSALNCDRAFAAQLPESRDPSCPFELADTSVVVSSLGDAFAIDVTSENSEIAERARTLAAKYRECD